MVLIMRTQPVILDPICNAYKSIVQQSKSFWSGCSRHRHWPSTPYNGANYGAINIVVVGLQEDVAVRFRLQKLGATACRKWFYRRCGGARCQAKFKQNNLGLVIECSVPISH